MCPKDIEQNLIIGKKNILILYQYKDKCEYNYRNPYELIKHIDGYYFDEIPNIVGIHDCLSSNAMYFKMHQMNNYLFDIYI